MSFMDTVLLIIFYVTILGVSCVDFWNVLLFRRDDWSYSLLCVASYCTNKALSGLF